MSVLFDRADFPHGLRCAECNREFVEGQPIAEKPYAMDAMGDGEPLVCVELVCRACAFGDEGGANIVPLPPDIQGLLP